MCATVALMIPFLYVRIEMWLKIVKTKVRLNLLVLESARVKVLRALHFRFSSRGGFCRCDLLTPLFTPRLFVRYLLNVTLRSRLNARSECNKLIEPAVTEHWEGHYER